MLLDQGRIIQADDDVEFFTSRLVDFSQGSFTRNLVSSAFLKYFTKHSGTLNASNGTKPTWHVRLSLSRTGEKNPQGLRVRT